MSSEPAQPEPPAPTTPPAPPAPSPVPAPPMFSLQAGPDQVILPMLDPPRLAGMRAALGEYDIVRVIGMGGMGVVVLARAPNRAAPVAIKLLRAELTREPRAVQRFLVEARHMSKLAHEHILPVLEVADRPGSTPYYVMPYLPCGSLASLTAAGPLDESNACEIALEVASAVAHAHEHGIIHRDLKPANILLDERGDAHVSDFGLVRTVFNDTLLEPGQGHCEGSAAYMSPAVAAGLAEDTRCDIYSFGATLYEMLTGRPPYEGRTSDDILRKVRAGPPPPVLTVNPKASPRLTRVCAGAMARELRDRYARMQDVVTDLQRIARGQDPLGPRGPAPGARLRAHPLVLASVVLLLLSISGFFLWRAMREPRAAAPRATSGRLERIITPGPPPQAAQVQPKIERAVQLTGEVFALQFTPDGRWLYAAQREEPESMIVVDATNLELKFGLKDPAFGYPVAISGDSRLLVSPHMDGPAVVDLATGTILKRLPRTSTQGTCALSADGKLVANYAMEPQPLRHVLSVLEMDSGKRLATMDFPADQGVMFIKFLDDDRILVGSGIQGMLYVVNWRSGQILHEIHAHTSWPSAIALSRDRTLALTGGQEGTVFLWDLGSGRAKLRLLGHSSDVSGVAFLPDGNLLTADAGGNVIAWDGNDGHELWRMRTPMPMTRMDASPDGKRFAIGTSEGHVYLFTLPPHGSLAVPGPTTLPQPTAADEESGRYFHHRYEARCIAIAPDGRRAVSGDASGVIACFELNSGTVLWSVRRHDAPVYRVQFLRGGAEVLSSGADGAVRISDAADGSEKAKLFAGKAACVAAADDASSAVAVAGHSDAIRVIDLASGREKWSIPNNSYSFHVTFSPDGKLVAHCRNRFAVFVHEAETGREITKLLGHDSYVGACCFVNGSDTILTGSSDNSARLWDVRSGTVIREMKHDGIVGAVAVSPDGRLAATVGTDFLKLWDLRSGQLLHSFAASKDGSAVQFTPDGRSLLTAGPGAVVRAWRIPPSAARQH